ncbi:MAG TPA: hypothetical protein VFT79_05590 [Solirubrobacterales bacterium]|nr:hypothetical protein [Solirubrobacterales bacterium]
MEWVALNQDLGVEVVISNWFGEWLEGRFDVEADEFVAPEDRDGLWERVERLRGEGVADLRRFDHHEVRLEDDAYQVQMNLIDSGRPGAVIWADEWAYLQSNSWLTSKLRLPVEAFRDAGAAILEFGKRTGINLIAEVIPRDDIPASINAETIGRAAVKWIVVGGATIGGGTLGGLVGPVGGAAGGFLANRLSKAAALAIDP